MPEIFHWRGTAEVAMNRLYKWMIGLQKAGAPSLRNHGGSVSRPVAGGHR